MNKSKAIIGIGLIALILAIVVISYSYMPRIYVNGTGTVIAYPDEAWLSFGVRTQNSSAALAVSNNAAMMTAVFDALTVQNVTKDDIKTVAYSLSPIYEQTPIPYYPYDSSKPPVTSNGSTAPKIVGYEVVNSLQVIVKSANMAKIGNIIDGIVQAGVTDFSSLTFTLSDATYASLQSQAYKKAAQDADRQAHTLVGAVGGVILGVASISTSYVMPPYYDMMVKGGSGVATTPIASGQVQVSATISISYYYI